MNRTPLIMAFVMAIGSNSAFAQEPDCGEGLGALSKLQIEARAAVCPTSAEVLYHLGKARLRERNYDEAGSVFLRALEMPGKIEKELRLALGDIELHRGDYSAARDIYLKLANDFPDWNVVHNLLGLAYFATGDLDSAYATLTHSIELLESSAAYRTLALVAYSLDQWDAAIDAVNRGYELDEGLIADRDFIISGIRSYTEIGRFDVARGLLAALLNARPELRTDEEYLRAGFYLKERMVAAGLVAE